MIRLVATDLDGTLVRSDGTVSDRTVAALGAIEDAGLMLVMVTGRPPRWMAPIVEATGHRGVALCANGAITFDLHTETVVDERPLHPEPAMDFVRALRHAVPEVAFAVERAAGFSHEPDYHPRWPPDVESIGSVEEITATPMTKLLARHEGMAPDEFLAAAVEVSAGIAVTLTHSSSDGLLEVSAEGVHKGSGLRRLAAAAGISADEVLAFGDMPNDVPMLSWAGTSYAVANAHPLAAAAASRRTASNDDDGVAIVLEELLSRLS